MKLTCPLHERAWGLIDRQLESRLHAVLPVKIVRFVRDVVPRHFHRLDDSPRLGQEVDVEVGVGAVEGVAEVGADDDGLLVLRDAVQLAGLVVGAQDIGHVVVDGYKEE